MSFLITGPYEVFNDLDGDPLENGNIYIGEVSLNPETNPVAVYWDAALTLAATQPIRTLGGYPDQNGTPANLYIAENSYSITLRDKNNKFIYSDLGAVVVETSVLFYDTIADMTALLKSSLVDDQQITVGGYNSVGDEGGDGFYWDSASAATANLYNIFASDEGGNGRWFRNDDDTDIRSAKWGFVDGADNTTKAQAMHTYAAALTDPKKIRYNDGSSTISSEVAVTSFVDGMEVDFGTHEFNVTVGANFSAFSFGDPANVAASPTPNNYNLHTNGGVFDQALDAVHRRYITVYDTQGAKVQNSVLNHAGNGAIMIGQAVIDFDVSGHTSLSVSTASTRRAIWINGSSVTGYLGQVVDTDDFTLISSNPSTILRGKVHHNVLHGQQYGIYLMNVRDVDIFENDIVLDNTIGTRCIAVNNYSPRTNVYRNRFETTGSATGVLFTQASTECTLTDNNFFGDFIGGRDVYIQYIAEIFMRGNIFNTNTNIKIQINNGGFVMSTDNHFRRRSGFNTATKTFSYTSIDALDLSHGGTAVEVGGLISQKDFYYHDGVGALVTQNQSSTGGNYFGADVIDISNNTFFNRNLANYSSGEAILTIEINDDAKPMNYICNDNLILPFAATRDQSQPFVTGTDVNSNRVTDLLSAMFNVSIVSTVVTVTKISGERFICSGSLSGTSLLLIPRTGSDGQPSVSVADIMNITPKDTTTGGWLFQDGAANNPVITLLDNAGAAINLTTTDADVNVYLSYKGND